MDDSVRAYYLREKTYLLRESEFTTLVEIGKFRVVDSADLAQFAYRGDPKQMARDVRRLERHGLVERKPVAQEPKRSERLVVLTKKAKRLLLNCGRVPQGQAIYHGFVKPRELKHDAALYHLCQKEAKRIAQAGGRPLRVVLDYELKRNVQRELAGLGDAAQTRDARERVAAQHGLVLAGDRIQIPDLRLEYETADHERCETDLELATRNYRPRTLAKKAKAGFSIYAPREDASKVRRIFDMSELTARVFTL
jgi:DNA-binding MarR family transcriptional regulator